MPTIHPTAIIDSKAVLADDVRIGPYCVIEGDVTLGAGCELISHVCLRGPVTVGEHNRFWPFSAIGFEPQDVKFAGATAGVVIGSHNRFREGATVHCATSTEKPTTIGDHCFIMTNAHVGHDCIVHNRVMLVTGSMLGGFAEMYEQSFVGGASAVHQFCRLGRLAFLGGCSCVTRDLPPFCMANYNTKVIGLNRVGLRRAGMPREAIDTLATAFRIFYRSKRSVPNALIEIESLAASSAPGSDLLREFVDFVRASKKGIAPFAGGRENDGD